MAAPVTLGIIDRSGDIDGAYTRNYSETYLVETDDLYDAAYAVVNAPGIPSMWDEYQPNPDSEIDTDIWVSKKSARPHGGHPNLWAVQVEYSSTPPDPEMQASNPLNIPALKKPGIERYRRALEYDVTGAAIVNSAGDKFESIEVDAIQLVFTVTKNLDYFDYVTFYALIECVNNAAWDGYQAGQLKIHDISTTGRDFKNGTLFYPTTFTFHVRKITDESPQPWRLKLLDTGFRYFDLTLNDYVNIIDAYNHNVSQPALLDGAGGELAHGGTPQYLTYQVHDEIDFAILPLAPPFLL